MIDEKSLRKPGFNEENCVPVALADGQIFYFPRVWLELRPRFVQGRATEMKMVSSAGSELDSHLKAVETAAEAGEGDWAMEAASLAAFMLSKNYDLTDDVLSDILVFPINGPNAYELLRTIMDVARGRTDPKEPETSGSDAPS